MKKMQFDKEVQRRMAASALADGGGEPDGGRRIVEGYAATFGELYTLYEGNDMRVMERIMPDAFDGCKMDDVIFQFDHEGRVFARTTNGTLELSTDAHGLKVRADLGGTEDGRRLHEEIKGGYINRMSFSFTVDGWEEEEREGADGRHEFISTITGISRLYDVSAVSIPANGGTEIGARALSRCTEAAEELRRSASESRRQADGAERSRLALELELELERPDGASERPAERLPQAD